MKLWQKIFLLTLALVIAVVNITALALLSNNHSLVVEREQQEALSRHNYIVADIKNRIIYNQLRDRVISLSDEEALAVTREVLSSQRSNSNVSLSLYLDKELIYSVNQVLSIGEAEESLLGEEDYSSVIVDAGSSTYLLLMTTLTLNDTDYQLVSSFDISATYELFEADLDLVSIISVISALLVAGVLLLLTRALLGPLQSLTATTRLIAGGDLEKRVVVKGNDEVSEVARSLNFMADSIEQNVTALENLAESRRIFISNLAHEMKTPLTSILGFADLLRIKRSVSDEERQEYADIIVAETKHLQGLSGKLMELLTTQNVQLSFNTINAQSFVEQLVQTLEPLLNRTGTNLAAGVDALQFEADPELLTSLLYNLIDNAVKASKPGDTITLSIDAIKGGTEGFSISVSDEGIGIPADQIPLLTEPFYMVDKSRTRKHGGAGLGLALCVEIARAHGATLDIESKLGRGTRVQVVFPASSLTMNRNTDTAPEEVPDVI